ncbi:sensor histidine kinase [Virgibacillus pantothenticus]|uniref:sensor histidine kinase n=1 Tax=Virgibacillus pantothenticus TaxID=1473 RepID=UPI000985C952|nr:sensor histidine kinase [Virgibacillus pantothenticus]
MLRKLKTVSLKTKILTLLISLILAVIILLSGIYIMFEKKQTEEDIGNLALQVAKTVSFMPSVKTAFENKDQIQLLQSIADSIKMQVEANYIVIKNADGVIYAHPDLLSIGKKQRESNYRALIFGQYYNAKIDSPFGTALTGNAPIFGADGNIIGIVSVGYLYEDIYVEIYRKIRSISAVSIVVLLIGIIGGIMLTNNIRKDTLGLEPFEIANLYRQRSAILHSIKEGIIAIDENGLITMINQPAIQMLGCDKSYLYESIEKVFPNTLLKNFLNPCENEEIYLHNRLVIMNREVVKESGKVIGAVASFRDKTDVKKMIETISEVRQYSEDLRAQTHEYANKLYVLSGLMQLGKFAEAVDMIQAELKLSTKQNHLLFDRIEDSHVQAILLGKIAKASEKKIQFIIDQNSSLSPLPKHMELSSLIAILGNIMDNAFEAVSKNEEKKVVFFATDVGNDVIFEVADNGSGIMVEEKIFTKGFSTKLGERRGYGLAIVQDTVNRFGGCIEIQNDRTKGAIFTVFLPKKGDCK